MKSLCLPVCLSVCLSIHPALSFLKIRSLVFSDVVDDNSWPWYLVSITRLKKKKIDSLNLGPMDLNQDQNEIFSHFIEFGWYVFLEIASNDSLWQYLTSSRNKTLKKNLGAQIWAKQVKIRPKILFLVIFSSLVH